MNGVIIPDIDAIPLPAPIWLLRFLSHLTFILHIIPMNIVLGGGFLAVALAWYGRSKDRDDISRLAGHTASALPAATAFSITLGVPPLLFLQVLYGPVFYTGAVLIAWPWLAVVGVLIFAYYGYYWFTIKKDAQGRMPIWAGLTASFLFLFISFMYSNMMTLMIQPEKFAGMYAERAHGLMLNAGDAMMWPRWLHFVVGAVAVSSMVVMIVGLIFRKKEPTYGDLAIRIGGLTFVITTIVQMAVGVWQLLALRRDVMLLFMGGDMAATVYFGVAILCALVAMMLILIAAMGKSPKGLTITGAVLLLVTIVLMTLMRSVVRDAYLGQNFVVDAQPVDPNWFVVILFVLLLVGGLATVGWMLAAALTKKGMEHGRA